MALTLNEKNVNNSSRFYGMLNCLQANILKHHGREVALHLFFSIKSGQEAEAQKWISDFAVTRITSAFKQLVDTDNHKKFGIDGGTVLTLSLAASAYKKLGIDENLWPEDPTFAEGMKFPENKIADDVTQWDEEFQKDADLLIIVADTDGTIAEKAATDIIKTATSFEVLKVQKGKILRNRYGIGIEHFGYADGISQPLFMEEELTGHNPQNWSDEEPIKLALVKDKGVDNEDSYGSYLVFRKLEQNVKAFKEAESQLNVLDAKGKENDELAGAMVVGRFEDGTPTLLSSHNFAITNADKLPNDFNYSKDAAGQPVEASKCPFHSHIRITNPRADVSNEFAHSVRLVRRGIPFDEINRESLDFEPEGGVGLLFMCYQASIVNQFQFIQDFWVNRGDIGGRIVGQDGIIGQGANTTAKKLPEKWGQDTPNTPCEFSNPDSGFVKMRGGEYFFTPSICFLKSLFTGTTAAPAMEALL